MADNRNRKRPIQVKFFVNEQELDLIIECLPYVDAYNKYHIPIIQILRAFSRIDYQKKGYHFSDATIDQLNSNYITSWGFAKKYGRWHYKNHYVEMGDLLPLPKELAPLDPIPDHELVIEISLKAENNDGKFRFIASSNIPEETPIIFSLRGNKYAAQCKTVVNNNMLISEWFSDNGNPLKQGFYTINLTCPIDRVLPSNVQKIFGERNRNIIGNCVKFEPIGGNTIHFSCGLLVKNNYIQVIDMQQRISDL